MYAFSDSSESRSRSLKDCVYQGFGRGLNKQKPSIPGNT